MTFESIDWDDVEPEYCTCQRGRLDGFGRNEAGEWVHSACGKQTKTVHDKLLVEKILNDHGYRKEPKDTKG